VFIIHEGVNGMSDWWSTLDSEQSQSEVIHMDLGRPICRAPDFVQHSLDEHDGLHVSVGKGQQASSSSSSSSFICPKVIWRRSVVVSALSSINVVNHHWAQLVVGWVTVCGRVHHLGNNE